MVAAADDDAEALASAADSYARLGRFDDALELAGRAKDENGQMPEPARRAAGLCLASRGDSAKALDLLNGPDPDALVLSARIRARLMLGDLAGAAADADAAKRVEEPTAESREAAKQVAALLQRRNQIAKSADGDQIRALTDEFVCAEYLCTAGQGPERVAELLHKAIDADAALGPALGLRAILAVNRGLLTKGLADAEKAVQLAPTDFRGFLARGRIRFERGDALAVSDLKKAVELSEHKNAAALHAYASALAHAGKRDDALAAQRTAAKLQPATLEYQEQLKEFESKK